MKDKGEKWGLFRLDCLDRSCGCNPFQYIPCLETFYRHAFIARVCGKGSQQTNLQEFGYG